MPAQTFVDDSGGKGQGRHFVLAGLIAPSEDWALFSEEWSACLRQHSIRVFKMREAAAKKGPFHLSISERDNRLRQLARIINRYAKIVIYFAVDLNALAQTWAKTNIKPLNEPYFWPFHNLIAGSCLEPWDRGLRERFEIIFDEQVIFGPRAKAWYPVIRESIRLREPDSYSIMPVDPLFRTDDEFLPIQAADLFAWCFRNGNDKPEDQRFDWLLEELKSVDLSEYSGVYDLGRIQGVDQWSERLIRENDPALAKVIDVYRKTFDE